MAEAADGGAGGAAQEEEGWRRRAFVNLAETVTLILFHVFVFFVLLCQQANACSVLLVHLIDVPITSREADRGCASAKDPGGNRGA